MSIFQSTMPTMSTISVRSGAGVAKMKYFTFEGHTFSPIYLAGLAEEIKYDYLKVKQDTTKDGSSGYSAITNTIYLNFIHASSIEQKAMIVHEATHAMFDFQGRKMDVATSESLSYIAQCMYVQLNKSFDASNPDDRLGSWAENESTGEVYETVRDGVFKTGWRIAAKIIAGGSVDASDVSDMRNAVSAHPYYASTFTQKTDFNGYR